MEPPGGVGGPFSVEVANPNLDGSMYCTIPAVRRKSGKVLQDAFLTDLVAVIVSGHAFLDALVYAVLCVPSYVMPQRVPSAVNVLMMMPQRVPVVMRGVMLVERVVMMMCGVVMARVMRVRVMVSRMVMCGVVSHD